MVLDCSFGLWFWMVVLDGGSVVGRFVANFSGVRFGIAFRRGIAGGLYGIVFRTGRCGMMSLEGGSVMGPLVANFSGWWFWS